MYEKVKTEKNKIEFVIKLNKKEWEKAVDTAYENNKEKFAVQGFRKGKAPRKVIEQNYGVSIFYDDAFDIVLSEEYQNILKDNTDIEPVASPEIEIKNFDDNGVEVSLIITTLPEVKLGAYTGLKIDAPKGEVTDAQVDAEVDQVRNRGARFVPVEREARMHDFVVIDFVGKVDGVEFAGGKAEDYRLELGSRSFIDTFEEQIIGMNIGEKRTIKVTFPENYTAELKGKPAEFEVTLNKVEEKQLPELNDEFASNVSEFETLVEFKADIKKHLEESLKNKLENELEGKIIEAIVNNSTAEIPDVMANAEVEAHIKDFEARLAYQGMKLEDYFNYVGTTLEEFKKSDLESARNSVKSRLVLKEIIKKENLFVSSEELDTKLQEIATKYKKSIGDYKKSLNSNELSYFENGILREKLVNFLKTNNQIN